jgi:hypothetical protein
MKTVLLLFSLGAALPLAAGCVVAKPYEREALALPPMSPGGDPSLEDSFTQHWRESREGGAGGYAAAGGGCGCN